MLMSSFLITLTHPHHLILIYLDMTTTMTKIMTLMMTMTIKMMVMMTIKMTMTIMIAMMIVLTMTLMERSNRVMLTVVSHYS